MNARESSSTVDVSAARLARDKRGRFLHGKPDPTSRSRSMRGNLNGTRYPWRTYWRRRAVRPEDRWILPLVASYGADLVSDKGGPAHVTAGEAKMIELAQLARGCTLLVLAAAKDGGLLAERKGPDLPAALAAFMRVEAQCLRVVGLSRRARPVDLAQYVTACRGPLVADDPAVG